MEKTEQAEFYMRRAIALALLGKGKVNPNPMVGAVIVKDGKVIGEGYHHRYGQLHAERDAFANLTEDAKGAEMYVTLEPCCHYGKQPPCTQAIIEHGISKVYIGSNDPNELVAGQGIQQLIDAGIEVVTGILKEECDAVNSVFFHYITTKTPYVVMKYAQTLDGKIATYAGNSKWITGEKAREDVQRLRNWLKGIMVGVQTVIADNPMLNCRMEGGENPVRIICDSHLRIPTDCKIVETAREIPTYIATLESSTEDKFNKGDVRHDVLGQEKKNDNRKKKQQLEEKGVQFLYCRENQGRIDLKDLMNQLGEKKIDSILLEGGSTLNESALRQGIVNHICVYIAPKIFGGLVGYTPVGGKGIEFVEDAYLFENLKITQIGEDILLEYDVAGSMT